MAKTCDDAFSPGESKKAAGLRASTRETGEKIAVPAIMMHLGDDRYPALDPVKGAFPAFPSGKVSLDFLAGTLAAMQWDGKRSAWCAPETKIHDFTYDFASQMKDAYSKETRDAFVNVMTSGAGIRACTATSKSTIAVTQMRKILKIK
jgi:hypothetical protein